MKKILLGAAALSLIAAPAFAQSTSTVNINGNVAAACSAALPTQTIDLNAQLGGSMIDATGFTVAALHAPGSIAAWTGGASAWCNGFSSRITVEADPLVNVSVPVRGAPAGFDTRFDLEVTGLSVGGVGNVSLTTNRVTGTASANTGAFAGPITGGVRILPLASGLRPLAGDYRGAVRVTIATN